jgi:Lipid desaturase domain
MRTPFAKLAPPLIAGYFAALSAGLYRIDWDQISWLSGGLTFYAALFIADFISGLVHLYIDYQPLNYAKGYNRLYFYPGDRGSEEFARHKRQIAEDSSLLDMEVYHFKIHHRNISPYLLNPYRFFFYETIAPATALLAAALVYSAAPDQGSQAAHLSFGLLIVSVAVLHTNHIHAWVHGSRTMPWGVACVRLIQRLRLMYSNQTHARHHRWGESGFCFIVGHANFLVDAICRLLLRQGVIHKRHWEGLR